MGSVEVGLEDMWRRIGGVGAHVLALPGAVGHGVDAAVVAAEAGDLVRGDGRGGGHGIVRLGLGRAGVSTQLPRILRVAVEITRLGDGV